MEELNQQIAQPIDSKPPEPTLADKLATVKMFVKVHSLLADGLFPGKHSVYLNEARGFIERMHAEATKMWKADPNFKEEQNGTEEAKGTTTQNPAN